MRSDISDSMLVFPKYARFLTSKLPTSCLAVPSAIYERIFESMAEQLSRKTYQPAKVHLTEFAVSLVFLFRDTFGIIVFGIEHSRSKRGRRDIHSS